MLGSELWIVLASILSASIVSMNVAVKSRGRSRKPLAAIALVGQ